MPEKSVIELLTELDAAIAKLNQQTMAPLRIAAKDVDPDEKGQSRAVAAANAELNELGVLCGKLKAALL